MKTAQCFSRSFAVALALLPLLLSGCKSTSTDFRGSGSSSAAANVTKLGGAARISCDSSTWQKLRVGSGVNSGCIVQTAVNSFVEIVYEDSPGNAAEKGDEDFPLLRNRIVLEADTAVRFDALPKPGDYAAESDIRMTLSNGKIMSSSVASADSPVVEVHFGNMMLRGRSATFLVDARGVVQVARGAVAVTTPDGLRGRAIAEGFQYNTQTGEISRIAIAEPTENPAVRPAPVAPPPRIEPGPPPRKF